MNQNIILALGFLLLALEHFDIPIPRFLTGLCFVIVAILMLL